ncbi:MULTISPECIES: universal stress protein [Planococcus]|uniref:Universal stress protein n=2 Tax=Planococcus TaxID=1372 RepID=A0ABM5WZH6_9BACL|nr:MULTISPECIES: universal stress protein [Planococcus]ALS79774.1 universal stress protein [Planococcus kocurii]AQU78240.1 universal stress protein [Planococcus faecalis]KAA0957182.1 universal stress protein [Planococcus sp. ANT_H30]MDJ0332807.1 universal stress protein [Planococcus sp. S3-L1]OHX53823.1 universal stress protein [Planococcus faecalis]
MYEKILVAADGSDHSKRAAHEAVRMAKTNPQAFVTLLYVIDYEKARTEILHGQSSDEVHLERRKHLVPLEEIFRSAGINFETKTLHGVPGPTIVKHANETGYDVVLIGSRGLNTLQEMVLGSVSHKVAKRVEAPVIIVK